MLARLSDLCIAWLPPRAMPSMKKTLFLSFEAGDDGREVP